MLFQKLGDAEYCDGWILSVVQVFDKVFDELSELNAVEGICILPLCTPPGDDGPSKIEDYIPSFDFFMRATIVCYKKADYPSKHFTFIGNKEVPKIDFESNDQESLFFGKRME